MKHYTPLCDAIVTLLDPLIEIAIHNIEQNKIIYINGKLSKRSIGDPSLLDRSSLSNLNKEVYAKMNFDGRLIKSISIKLDEEHILCINCDISIFTKMQELSSALMQTNKQPESLFKNDWQEKLNISIHSYLQTHNLSFEHLSQSQTKELIKHLFELGAFNEKNAADYIAKSTKLGRATIFKYLKEWRNK